METCSCFFSGQALTNLVECFDPRGQIAFNLSKETTKKEVIKIEGIDEYTYKMQNINLSGGPTNALEYCQTMFNTPTLPEMLELFEAL